MWTRTALGSCRSGAADDVAKRYSSRRASALKPDIDVGVLCESIQFVVDVGFDVFAALAQSGHLDTQKVDSGEQIIAKPARRGSRTKVTIGAGDQLKIALDFLVRPHRRQALFFDGLEQPWSARRSQGSDFIEEYDAAMSLAEQAGAIGLRTGRRHISS